MGFLDRFGRNWNLQVVIERRLSHISMIDFTTAMTPMMVCGKDTAMNHDLPRQDSQLQIQIQKKVHSKRA